MAKDQFDEFFEDVQKDIRAERFTNLWKKYGKLITGGMAGVFLMAGVYVLWSQHLERQNQEQALQFTTAQNLLMNKRTEEALAVLSNLAQHQTSYGILATFQQAAQDPKNALSLYQKLATTASSLFFQDLARVLYVMTSCDTLKSEEIEKLKVFLEPALKGPWHLLALDLNGFLLYNQAHYKEASDCFVKIAQDSKCPEGLKLRAQIFAQDCVQRMRI